jgi:photosynthetic reaction center cytochrome c subunit
MTRTARKRLLVLSAVLIAFATALFAARAQSPQPDGAQQNGAKPASERASEQFKNIQILKDIPGDQIIPAMQFISASLGVDCEYCHVEHAFDKDEKKPKVTARKMMEMMIAINRENFEGRRDVTCYTCHQGGAKPVSIPLVSAREKSPEVMEGSLITASGNPAPESLLDKYLAAVGGADALKKISTRVAKGTVTTPGDQPVPIELFARAPDKRVSVVHGKEGESVTAYNGKVGWLSVPGRVHMMNAQESFGAKMDADLAFAANVKSLYPMWETLPGEKIDGHDTWLVVGRREGQPPLKLYLDQGSHLLLRLVRYADSPLGYNPTQVDYADYRPVDGVKTPYRWTVARPRGRFTIQLEQLQQNVSVDDAKFILPPPPPPPAPAH